MRITNYTWQQLFCIGFLQMTLVALVPISTNCSVNITSVDPPSVKERSGWNQYNEQNNSRERNRRQIDYFDEEFKGKTPNLLKEEVSIDSESCFFPVWDNDGKVKVKSGGPAVREQLKRIKEPKGVNEQIPLYDDDVKFKPDPLRGVLDPKYWEQEKDASSKIKDFFVNTMMGKMMGLDVDVSGNNVIKSNDVKVDVCRDEGCDAESGGLGGKSKLKETEGQHLVVESEKYANKENDYDSVNGKSKVKFIDSLNSSQIQEDLVSNLGEVMHSIVDDVVSGIIKNSENNSSKLVKNKTSSKSKVSKFRS